MRVHSHKRRVGAFIHVRERGGVRKPVGEEPLELEDGGIEC